LDSKGIIYLGNIEHSINLSTHLTINDYIWYYEKHNLYRYSI
jgi:hypothetical protein